MHVGWGRFGCVRVCGTDARVGEFVCVCTQCYTNTNTNRLQVREGAVAQNQSSTRSVSNIVMIVDC